MRSIFEKITQCGFAASSAGCLFSSLEDEMTYRYIEVGLES